ncbi:MAG: leucine--tRNA ligase [Nitrososphaerota archaeon]|nr:leucine--tRNA ligase [Candidatus Bathyarchaeota archaeon]MDW8023943.1 leucine--tRNA ligase [Nitrososphaerota archaeon]
MEVLRRIEEKWQKRWEEAKIFEANPDPSKPKFFITVAYPYPNSPQHIGHARTYTLADVHARYMRMRGYNVLLPMAFHYTGTPVLAMAKRLAEGDEELTKDFVEVYKVPREKLKELTDPLAMARYFHEEIKEGMKRIGYSIDWRREFTTIDPQYNRFIEWQFHKLHQAGYITRGSHPVGWCPKDGNPVGQHDTIGDVEPEIGDFTLIKFKHEEWVLPTATLRPETVFGVTNIWLNPKTRYVKALVDGEKWIVSQECAEKLTFQNRKVTVLENFEGKALIGKFAENPATNSRVLILPADFVDPKNATGVVMSVPGHAPYDYVALENIKANVAQLREYKLDAGIVNAIKPISIIEVPSYSEIPAEDVVRRMGIREQTDPKLEDATREVYRHEFHNGRMKSNTGKYSGLPVAEAKEKVKQNLIAEGKATIMYELLNKPVKCRCGTECVVKIFEDQWFIDYGKPEWKALARKCLENMQILPEELRDEYNYVIDWLHEKACARKSGLGTRLPWDPQWIIESLSDSTIYMAYYTIARYIKEYGIQPNQLTNEVFDYIFLGVGNAEEVAKKAGVNEDTLEKMRGEFLYFYPLDSRHSAHELIPNHLTFMIFNHTAIFPENLWPRQIVTNGHVTMEGQKMSKSFGNIIPLREGLAMFGADPIRLSVLATAELLQDADFSPSIAKAMRDRLERLYNFVVETSKASEGESSEELAPVDRWMLSRLQGHIKKATESMEKLAVRKVIQTIIFELEQDLQWYQKRAKASKKSVSASITKEVLKTQIQMLAPFAPHICEELWDIIGGKSFVSLSPWPKPDETKVDVKAEEMEAFIGSLLEDTLNIVKATGITPKKVFYYTAASWKWQVYTNALELAKSEKLVQSSLIRKLFEDQNLRAKAKETAEFAAKIVEEINRTPVEKRQRLLNIRAEDEEQTLRDAGNFIKREINAEIHFYDEEDPERYDPQNRARLAKPLRPAIYIE